MAVKGMHESVQTYVNNRIKRYEFRSTIHNHDFVGYYHFCLKTWFSYLAVDSFSLTSPGSL